MKIVRHFLTVFIVAGNERRHFHGRNSELRRMLNSDSSSDWKLVNQVRKVVTDGGLESLQAIKQQGNEAIDQVSPKFFISYCRNNFSDFDHISKTEKD